MPHPEAFYLPSGAGQRYSLYHAAQGPLRGLIVYVHPFAEELNKTRRMAALQARALAQAGYGVLQIDLLGCGDSSGDFADARWDAWIADILQASQWLDRHAANAQTPRWLWSLRGGCLLAADAVRAMAKPCHLLLWQPSYASGALLLQQFLRLQLAADLLASAEQRNKGAMDALRQRLAAGETLDIAGYRLAPELASAIDRVRLDPPPPAPGTLPRLCILEASSHTPAEPSPLALRTQATWQAAGWRTRVQAATGPAFWQSSEIEEAPALLTATLTLLDDDEGTA